MEKDPKVLEVETGVIAHAVMHLKEGNNWKAWAMLQGIADGIRSRLEEAAEYKTVGEVEAPDTMRSSQFTDFGDRKKEPKA